MKKSKDAIVFTNGCFDIIHVGHVGLLQFCQKLAGDGELVIAVDSDTKIRKDKGKLRPVMSHMERMIHLNTLLHLLKQDTKVTIYFFNSDKELYDLIQKIEPTVIVKGGDWQGKKVVGSDLTDVVYYPRWENISTSEIIDKIKEKLENE